MASSEFEEIASLNDETEAAHIRGVLQEQGVDAFVEASSVNTTLSYIGSALGGVRVFVRSTDVEKAGEIIKALEDETETPGDAWFCGKCQEEVDGGFSVCWSCGGERAGIEQPFPDEHRETIEQKSVPRSKILEENTGYDQTNPYASPRTSTEKESAVEDAVVKSDPELDALLLRAWRASILGLTALPLIASFYSMYLLLCASLQTADFSPDGKKCFYRAFAINMAVFLVFGLLLRNLF